MMIRMGSVVLVLMGLWPGTPGDSRAPVAPVVLQQEEVSTGVPAPASAQLQLRYAEQVALDRSA